MGSCSSKKSCPNSDPIIKTSLNQKSDFGKELIPRSSIDQARKKIKQKKAVVDSRISNQSGLDAPTASIVEATKSARDIKLIKSSLEKHFIFNKLTDAQKNLIIEQMKFYVLNPNQIVFEQGNKGTNFFIISTGRLEVIVNGRRVNIIKNGESFGELALLHDTPRSATVKTIINTTLWALDRNVFRTILQQLSAKNYQENKAFIMSIPLFEILSDSQKDSLVNCLTSLTFAPEQKIVNEGDPGDLLYIIKDGSVLCTQNGKEIRTLTKGDYFGEQALLYGSQRTATVCAIDNATCLALNREELDGCLGESLSLIIYKNSMRIALSNNKYLKKLDKTQTENLINSMEVQSFKNGDIVIQEKKMIKNQIYVIVKGNLCTNTSKTPIFKVFDVIGIEELTNDITEKFKFNYAALGDVDITHISASGFFNAIGGDYNVVTQNNKAISLLKRIQLLKNLPSTQFQALLSMLKVQSFQDGMLIVEQNNPGDCFFLIKSGKVDVIKDGTVIRSITKNDYFGERSLLFNNFRSASVVANGKVDCWVLYKSDFLGILNENIKKILLERIELQDDTISLSDLVIVKLLGSGMFGNVFLVVNKQKKTFYSLKTVDRKKIQAYEIEENLILERKVLLELDHVLIMKLVKTFKDSKRLYFLVEYIKGMDLFDVLRNMDLLKEFEARFYIACICVMLEHLHERSIIYRDLKPENIVVDAEGYPKLIDLGTAKFVNGRTYTIVGTPHYMAPEVIANNGYGLAADYWTVGIMLYEFMFGCVPFGEDESNPYAIYQKIEERNLIFPKWLDNKNKVKEFINQLLSSNPANRLGGNFDNLKSNSWFVGFSWDKIATKELKAPYIPNVSDLDGVVEDCLNSNESMDHIITQVEQKTTIPYHRRSNEPPIDWDQDF